MGRILVGSGVPAIGNHRPTVLGDRLSVQPWRRLSIWRTTLNVRVLECLSMWTVISRASLEQDVRPCPLILRLQEVLSMVEFVGAVEDPRAVHHSRIPHHHTRFVGPIGQKPRCLSSLLKSELSGMAVITVINPPSLNSCMAPPHGNWCWRDA